MTTNDILIGKRPDLLVKPVYKTGLSIEEEKEVKQTKTLSSTEPQLVALFEEARVARQQLLSEAIKLEDVMWDYQKQIQELQRIRITAANARGRLASTSISDLEKKTGLSIKEINSALTILKGRQKDGS